MTINPIKVVKIVGTVMGVASTLILSWTSDKENASALEKLVNDKLGKN